MVNRTYHPRGKLVDGFRVRDHPLYSTWASMLDRCTNQNTPNYKDYGGREIAVCDHWHHFENFAKDMGAKPSSEHTIERVNNDRGYEPENCKWATRTEQCTNRRRFKITALVKQAL